MEISIEDFSFNYKLQILELFKKTFNRELSEQFWKWRFEKNPFGNPIIKVALLNQRIVGQYSLHPISLSYGTNNFKSLFSMTTMTDPEFSGQGIMTHLANEVYEKSHKLGFSLIFGFANDNSLHMFTKKLNFYKISTMNEFTISSSNIPIFEEYYNLIQVNNFQNENLAIQNLSQIEVPRTNKFMSWRFINHPSVNYHIYKILDGSDQSSYFVLKIYENTCHIVDFLPSYSLKSLNTILKQSTLLCKKYGLSKISLWCNEPHFLFYLKKIGFEKTLTNTHLIIKFLDESIDKNIFKNFNNWNLRMADSDVF